MSTKNHGVALVLVPLYETLWPEWSEAVKERECSTREAGGVKMRQRKQVRGIS